MSTFLASVAIASGVAWFVAGRVEPAVAPPVRFTIGFDTGGDAWRDLTDRPFVISPDGRAVVYRATTRGLPRLYIRTLDQLEPRPLVAGALVRTPFFSPDSQWVAFFEGATLKKVPVSGGPPVEIARITGGGAFGASWGDDGSIVFGSRIPGRETGIPLMLVPASGGEPIALTTVDPGMVGDTEFSDVRFQGDSGKKQAVYDGVRYLTPDDVADCILWAVTRPPHVNIDEIVLKPLQQASQELIVRDP